MKTLILIGGPMGVGKSKTAEILKKKLKNSIVLDGDNCWNYNANKVNKESKELVINNIHHFLNLYIKSKNYKNIIFTWVMHEDKIIRLVLQDLDLRDVKIKNFSLVCNKIELYKRLKNDIKAGLRDKTVIKRSMNRLKSIKNVHSIKINTSKLTTNEVADEIYKLL